MRVVIENGRAVWWCNGWTHPDKFTAWFLWWYDGGGEAPPSTPGVTK